VSVKSRTRFVVPAAALLALLFVGALPTPAEAQRRFRRPARVVVVAGSPYYAYPYWARDPWFQWRRYAPYGLRDASASVRIDAEPREAQVFIDGYYAGRVDQFDGVFQRLRVEPGGRTLTLFLEGYQTEEQHLYLRPGTDQRIRVTLRPLGPGERSIAPAPATALVPDNERQGAVEPAAAAMTSDRQASGLTAVRYGTLALRVQPADAEIVVDGVRWGTGAAGAPVTIRLSEGRHRVEVRRAGQQAYAEDVLIRRDRTLTVNVALD
jgi:hypothetical protein